MKKTLSLSEAKIKLNRLIDDIVMKEDEFVITKNGSPAAALIPAIVYEGWKETKAIQRDAEFMKEIKKGIEKLRKKGKRYTFKDLFGESL